MAAMLVVQLLTARRWIDGQAVLYAIFEGFSKEAGCLRPPKNPFAHGTHSGWGYQPKSLCPKKNQTLSLLLGAWDM
ncbi:hypothetical protein L208DRAFT_1418067 [Tricholoma matsutake]|nr:hypothetical protein L208DRAFT_1418067 [Tricholoma matsutake 945]